MSDVNPVRVLIVDDSDDQLLLLRTYFERAGCTVAVAGTAKDAMLAFDDAEPELTVIDLVLPGMDGWALAAHLQQAHPGCAIAITSVLDTADFPLSDAILPKPFTRLQVRQVLHSTVPRWVVQ